MFQSYRLFSAVLFLCFVFGAPLSDAAGPKPIVCYAVAFRKGGFNPEARAQAFGFHGNEAFVTLRALENCKSRYPATKRYMCVSAGCQSLDHPKT